MQKKKPVYSAAISTIPRHAGLPMRNQALEHAKAECAIAYTDTQVYRDITNHMWLVLFFTANTLGGCQEVYMDSSGITKLIVYGE